MPLFLSRCFKNINRVMATKKKLLADTGLETASDLSVDGNATITGNLTVNGTTVTVNSSTTSVTDSMIELAQSNTSSDTLDIGLYGNYNDGLSDGGASEYTGLFRDASDSTWKLFDGLEEEPTTTVNLSGTGYAKASLEVGDLSCTTITATDTLTIDSLVVDSTDGTTLTTTSSTELDSFSASTYRSAKYLLQASQGSNYHASEILVIHNGTNAYESQYGIIITNSSLYDVSVSLSSGSVRLSVTPASSSSTVFKWSRQLIKT